MDRKSLVKHSVQRYEKNGNSRTPAGKNCISGGEMCGNAALSEAHRARPVRSAALRMRMPRAIEYCAGLLAVFLLRFRWPRFCLRRVGRYAAAAAVPNVIRGPVPKPFAGSVPGRAAICFVPPQRQGGPVHVRGFGLRLEAEAVFELRLRAGLRLRLSSIPRIRSRSAR